MLADSTLIFGALDWLPIAAGIAVVLLLALAWGYLQTSGGGAGVRGLAFAVKLIAILLLIACLLEPLFSSSRARPGANTIALLADNSRSMTLRDAEGKESRAAVVKALADPKTDWLGRLRRDFEVRPYAFDSRLRSLTDNEAPAFDGSASDLGSALDRLVRRQQGRPLSGVVLFSDGSATDGEAVQRVLAQYAGVAKGSLPPIYPVIANESPADDVGVGPVAVTQTNFEDSPVTLSVPISVTGYRGKTITAQLVDDAGKVVEEQKLTVGTDGVAPTARFRVRPEKSGVSFYRVRAAADGEIARLEESLRVANGSASKAMGSAEATLANNVRTVAIDRGQGPYRVLYVAGRPNWEFKFLQRSLVQDDQVELVGLLRIAKREPKFAFIGRAGESSNPLFRGFGGQSAQDTGEYDKPIIVRFGVKNETELNVGFPKTAEELNTYHAVILDDLEAEFFSQDQMALLKEFVRHRGGGLLMLGGQESFKNGNFDRTPIGELLPVYTDEVPATPEGVKYRMALTREGWLEPWARLRSDEASEHARIAAMPPFQTINQVRGIKPGATVLARATLEDGSAVPALVEQRFGKGRVAALLLGDLWRWHLKRQTNTDADPEKAWRQTLRWLVGEVPKRVDVTVSAASMGEEASASAVTIAVYARDPKFAPLDNAAVTVKVTSPDGQTLTLPADPTDKQPGRYEATYVPRQAGGYRVEANVKAPDASDAGAAAAGFSTDLDADEFRELKVNRDLLQQLATASGGEVVKADDLDDFVADLPAKNAQVMDPYVAPIWHSPWVFLIAIACLAAEWGLRRWRGLP